ncbi:ribosome small subunit-dependent GTPase A [Chondromyces apiculatus]|uniref:Small ribosomal subunit biogenesis GTPase RsgA n=1 Tax=Chondromyces apiculatus DSM 436 TaxID=1192034 RepID=A0A017T1V8_9BACT|nr:ribosome small subunit-dependent GTPase A [Chondromyces apiculatus]EYF02835.1 putative GTPase [Chondromyces apiculatus DSM 436]
MNSLSNASASSSFSSASSLSSSLDRLGWGPFFEQQRAALADPVAPARIASGGGGTYQVLTERGPERATLSGRLLHQADEPAALPAVGDWVGLRPGGGGLLVHRFDRRTCLLRKGAGRKAEAQVLAANVDTVMVVSSLNADFNPRRLERYLEVVLDSGARPVFVLSKADLCEDAAPFLDAVQAIAPSAPVVLVSALLRQGLDALRAHVGAGETVVFVGSSGVGKSTLVNGLLGVSVQREGHIREHDERGRHTTTGREIFLLPDAGLLIDTPGIRELEPWNLGEGGPAGFDDIRALAASCRFRDCSHQGEPGCAVERALADGTLVPDRLEGFHKLEAEGRYLRERHDARARAETKRHFKQISRSLRRHPKG